MTAVHDTIQCKTAKNDVNKKKSGVNFLSAGLGEGGHRGQ